MQGSLQELDTANILQLIGWGQRSGELWIEAKDRAGHKQCWILFFERGSAIYAYSPQDRLSRLQDYLLGLHLDNGLQLTANSGFVSQLGGSMAEYEQLWLLLEERVLHAPQVQAILRHMIQEVIFELLCLRQGEFSLNFNHTLSPQLISLPLNRLVPALQAQVRQWYRLFPHIPSLDHCPKYSNPIDPDDSALKILSPLQPWLELQPAPTIRQIARYTQQEIIHVVKEVYEAIANDLIVLIPRDRSLGNEHGDRVIKIMCIDDSITACRSLEYILGKYGYQVISITDPIGAIGKAFQLQPHLILCDITMPQVDGYELCAMLRKTHQFAQTPIIMVTSQDGYIDRSKAEISGSNDYITKPFSEKQLVAVIKKQLSLSNIK